MAGVIQAGQTVLFDGIMAATAAAREPGFLAADGAHPMPVGHALVARTWLQTVGAI